jgi:hypothetical protein
LECGAKGAAFKKTRRVATIIESGATARRRTPDSVTESASFEVAQFGLSWNWPKAHAHRSLSMRYRESVE